MKKLSSVIIFVLIAYRNAKTSTNKLPSFLKICHQSDPNLNDCIKESVDKLRHLLKTGIPEFDIPSCEPLLIPEVTIDQGTGPVAVNSIYKNIKIYGPTEFVLKNVNINLDKNTVGLKIWLPHLEMMSNYVMSGRVLMMPISGQGKNFGNYSNIDTTIIIQGQKVKKDNDIYFHVKDFYLDLNIGHAKVQLNNLFNGDKELGDAMNIYLNENWRQLANEIKPMLEDSIAGICKKFANKIFHKYPLNILLPK